MSTQRIPRERPVVGAHTWPMLLVLVSLLGCQRSPPIAEVDGVLLVDGQPARKMRVQFVPDAAFGTSGPPSAAETDDQGRFTLTLNEGHLARARSGAVVGHHRVALTDLQLAESPTGRGLPLRLKSEYMLPASTPLRQEVREGRQTIEIRIP